MVRQVGQYGAQSSLLEYIYGITFEIWEERGVELIRQYYGEDIRVFALGHVSDGVDAVVSGTQDTLDAFPDRLLLAENVIWSKDPDGQYSSHRIMSPMTNLGVSAYGPATGKQVSVRTIADCFVQEGVITKEWLIRDTLPLVTQLGFNPLEVAQQQQQSLTPATRAYHEAELARDTSESTHELTAWAEQALAARWTGSAQTSEFYAPFIVSYPGPLEYLSGIQGVKGHATNVLGGLRPTSVRVDHVAVQAWGHEGQEVAVRWTMNVEHVAEYVGLPASNKAAVILGSAHWRITDERIATEWLVFDGMGVLAQLS